jgi:hypothetical protein
LKFCEANWVNDEVLSAGLRPVLEIDETPSPEDEFRNTSNRYVVLG